MVSLLSVPLSVVIIVLLILTGSTVVFEPPWLLPVMNTLFLGAIPVLIAYIAYRTYRNNGPPGVLLLGAGMLAVGLGSIAAGWLSGLPGGVNITPAIHNTAMGIGSVLFLAAVLLILTGPVPASWRSARAAPLFLYGGVVAFVAFFSYAAVTGAAPAFFLPGSGPTVLRQVVVSNTIVISVIAAALFFFLSRKKRNDFFFWFALSLSLIATGLAAILFQPSVGSLLGWAGRSAQYLGACFALVAILAARQTARQAGIPLPVQFGTFFGGEAATQAILAAAQESIWLFANDGTILMANPTALRRLGDRNERDVIGRHYSGFMSPAVAASRRARLDEVIRTRQPVRFEDMRDGIVFDHIFYPVFDDNGEVVSIAAFSRDVTPQRDADAALKENAAVLRSFFDSPGVMRGIVEVITDDDLRHIADNADTAASLSLKPEDMQNKRGSELGESREVLRILVSHCRESERSGRPVRFEYSEKRGERNVWLLATVSYLGTPPGGFPRFTYVILDISREKTAEKAAREREKEIRLVIDTVPALISHLDTGFCYIRVNKACEQWFGSPWQDIVGRQARDVLGEEAWKVMQPRFEKVMAGETDSFEALMPDRSGRSRWVSATNVPDRDARGKIVGIVSHVMDISQRKLTEEALRESEDRMRFALATSSIGAWELDLVDHTAHRSADHDRIFGYETPLPSWTYEMFLDHVLPEDRPGVDGAFRHAIGTKGDWNFACRIRRADGEIRWIQAAGRHRPGASGTLSRMAGVVQDITDRKLAEDALRAARDELEIRVEERTAELKEAMDSLEGERHRLYDVLETLPAFVCLLDRDYRMPFTNRYFRETFGDPGGRRCYEFLFNRPEPCGTCESYTVMKTRAPHHWFWTGPNGRDYDIHDYPFTDTDGSFMILEMGIDITERKKAEEALRNSHDLLEKRVADRTAELADTNVHLRAEIDERIRAEEALRETSEYLENLITYANAPIIVWDRGFRITRFNHAAEILTGRMAEDMIGQRIEVMFPETYVHAVMDLIRRTMTGERLNIVEIPVLHRSGDVKVVLWNSASLYGRDGKSIESTIAQGQDITVRKRAEAELQRKNEELLLLNEELTATQDKLQKNVDELCRSEQALRRNDVDLREALAEKDVLLAEIHHRVKNNLTAFISLLSLEGSYEESPSGIALKKDLQNRARSMALIHETLYRTGRYSRVEMTMYLTTLVEQIAGTFDPERTVTVAVSGYGIALDLGRATPCGLIVNELVTNSFKYAFPETCRCRQAGESPCTIEVGITEDHNDYVLTIRDNGTGFPPGFDPRTARSLGLKLVNFLSKHQLRATVDIQTGPGTAFELRFPVDQQQHRKKP